MKHRRLVIFVLAASLVLTAGVATSQQGWYRQVSGTYNSLMGVSFCGEDTGTVVGTSGTILHTTNGGKSWLSQNSGISGYLYAVAQLTGKAAICVGDYGMILRTTDGGATWVQASSVTTETLLGISFPDASNGYVVGSNGTVLRTTNGGVSWTLVTTGSSYYYHGVSFIDKRTGLVLGDNGLSLWTTDAGATWTSRYVSTNYSLSDVCLVSPTVAVVTGYGGEIYRTTDAGNTWSTISTGQLNYLRAVSFAGADTGYVVGESGRILRSTDGGATWTGQFVSPQVSFSDVHFANGRVGTAISWNGDIFRTTTGGRMLSLTSPNGGEVWVVGTTRHIEWVSASVDSVDVAYSADNGTTWLPVVGSLPAGAGSVPWLIPPTLSASCLVRVRDLHASDFFDVSDGPFTITEPPSMSVSPDSFFVTVTEPESTSVILTIGNGGPGILDVRAQARLVSGVPLPMPEKPIDPRLLGQQNHPVRPEAPDASVPRRPEQIQGPLPPGFSLQGMRILFDQVHSYVDTASFGVVDLVRDLKAAGAEIVVLSQGRLVDDTLSHYDVVIALDVSNYLAVPEVFALQRFVNRGGGILAGSQYNPTALSYWTYYAGIEAEFLQPGIFQSIVNDITLHPVTMDVDTLISDGYFGEYLIVSPPAVSLARVFDSTFMAASTYGAGNIVCLAANMWNVGYYSDDNQRMFLNAVGWVARQVPWLSIAPARALVQPAGSQPTLLTVHASRVPAGLAHAEIILTSNDPNHPEERLPFDARILGVPRIVVSPDTLRFEEVYSPGADTLLLEVWNAGSDTLKVNGMTSTNAEFRMLGVDVFDLPPRGRRVVPVEFRPVAEGEQAGNLQIASNDASHPMSQVVLLGKGLFAPVVGVSPDSLKFTLSLGQEFALPLTITNTGQGSLSFGLGESYRSQGDGGFDSVRSARPPYEPGPGGNSGRPVPRNETSPYGAMPQVAAILDRTTDLAPLVVAGDTVRIAAVRGLGTSDAGIISVWDYLNAYFSYYGTRPVRIDYTSLRGAITYEGLVASNANVLFISDAFRPDATYGYLSNSEINAIAKYTNEGHGLIITAGTFNTGWLHRHNRLAPLVGLDSTIMYRWNDGVNFIGTYISSFLPTNSPVFSGIFPSYYYMSNGSSAAVDGGWHRAVRNGEMIAFSVPEDSGAIVAYRNRIYFSTMPEGYPYDVDRRVLYNAMVWSGTTVPWLTLTPSEGTVPPGGNVTVSVRASTKDLECGRTYAAVIAVNSNDPATPRRTVPVQLTINGTPFMVASTDTLVFRESFVDIADTAYMFVRNTGCDTLRLLGFSTANAAFSVLRAAPVFVARDSSALIPVRFLPPSVGPQASIMTMTTNDPQHPTYQVVLQAIVSLPPVAAIRPDSVMRALHGGDSSSVIMTIQNSGQGTLRFAIGERLRSSSEGEWIGDTLTSGAGGTKRLQGNIYTVERPAGLQQFSASLDLATETGLTFAVYESDVLDGPYTRIAEHVVPHPGTGKRSYSSGVFALPLKPATYYLLGVGHEADLKIYRTSAPVMPFGTSFGHVVSAASITQYPPPASAAVLRSTSLVWTQHVEVAPTLLASATPDTGTVAPGDSVLVNVMLLGPVLPGRYQSDIVVENNDPLRRTLAMGVVLDVLTAVATPGGGVPEKFALYQNYPNPFNPSTIIQFDLPRQARVTLKVYNTLGQEVAVLINEILNAGKHQAHFDAAKLASGVYFYRLDARHTDGGQAGTFVQTRKLLLLR
jgi:photosystem II stability/assembly factor-like uncharacterized protein